ncbi:hypothetical protein J1N35_001349 [Gossypium stocksii]|uniref:Uncharacterized protein n=1 Tax=Gossypium stocksii TaxID=47602 RepID=A0A9D3WJ66_9ROSI|nr:hypothetical protein J1N35_001349 [Gossypium stocksii]
MPQEVKEHVFPFASSTLVKKSSLKELILSLKVTLAEASMASVGIAEGINEEEARKVDFENVYQSTMEALERDRELYKKLDKEIRKLVE